ncbi:MAG: beta-glucosidase BglX [Bacteroidetes bacterium]|nr:beta-glucosidase BglX [Bacteroidota bacterium]
MSLIYKISFSTLLWLILTNQSNAQILSATIEQKVENILQKMTIEEKIGQMNQYNGFWDATGPAPKSGSSKIKYDNLKKGLVGSVLNVKGVSNVRKLQEIAVKETRLGIPLLFGFDVIHGQKTIFPIPLASSCSWDVEAIENSTKVAAIEASAMGINWTFAPMLDISRDARWGRVMEGAGEDPYLASLIGVAQVKGFQGKSFSSNHSILATAKHFAGYGFVEAGREYNAVNISNAQLYNVILPPFKAVVDSGIKTVMNAFNSLNGIPATGNQFLLRDLLKDKWKFKGLVVSDWGSIIEMIDHGFAKDSAEAATIAANAGCDMDMESYAFVDQLTELVKKGKVDIKIIDEAVKRILRIKFELGLFDNPFKYCDENKEKELLYHPRHLKATLELAQKSIVLLKNENNLLPLKKSQKKIALIGSLANDKNSCLGNWRIASDDNTAISVLEGLQNISSNISYAKGADVAIGKTSFVKQTIVNDNDTTGFADAIKLAKASEVVIMVLGENGFQSGEGRSRSKIDLPGVQQQLLEEIFKVNKNIVLVLMNGRPLAITWAAQNIPAIIEAWQLGSQTGNAVASVLFGEVNPSAKLTMTFPRSVGQIPIYYNHLSNGRPNAGNNVFWSHYSDESNQPLYPFGFGLSYSKFKYSNLNIDTTNNEKIKVSVTIKNTSNVDGEEIAQLYIHDKVSSISRPVKELKAFKKLLIKANESKTVEFILTNNELGYYNNNGNFIIEAGEFEVMVGTNSDDVLKKTFNKM